MNTDKPKVAGYGLHYYATNYLLPTVSDRVLFQCLVDIVRKQLVDSLDNQTVSISQAKLGAIAGMDPKRTIPACLERLEKVGLIKKHKNGVTVNCDEFVGLIKCFESLDREGKKKFAEDFQLQGTRILDKFGNGAFLHHRSELIGISGSSISTGVQKYTVLDDESEKRCISTPFQTSIAQNGVEIHHQEGCKNTPKYDFDFLNGVEIHLSPSEILDSWAWILHATSQKRSFEEFLGSVGGTKMHHRTIEALKEGFYTGKFPKWFCDEAEKWCIFTPSTGVLLHLFIQKTVYFYTTVIIEDNNKKIINHQNSSKDEKNENFQNLIKKGFESFSKVEVVDLNQPSEEVEPLKVEEENSQLKLKRAEKALRDRNPYKAKPFIQVKRVVDMVNFIDEVVKSPVDIFINLFWERLYNLYLDHYNPCQRIDEEGEPVDEPQDYNWKEMLGAPLPQDEIYRLAQNIYADLVGAVEQGSYLYDEDTNFRVKFDFKEFPDFNPCQIFQWQPCTMKDKGIPALKVAMDRFFDIEAPDVSMPSKRDKRSKVLQNRKFIQSLLGAEDEALLTPLERAIRAFYGDFVALGEESIIDQFKDGRGEVLDYAGRFPDHLLKPWCCGQPGITYKEFTGAFASKYKPIDGLHKRSYVFSAEAVVEWNERNGYRDSLTHHAVQEP